MVAISLYRGNLHKPPDTPRRWPMPPHKISLKEFKTLLARRNKTLQARRAAQIDQTTPDGENDAIGVSEGNNGIKVDEFNGSASGSGSKGKQVEGFNGSPSDLGNKGKLVVGFNGSPSGSGNKGKHVEGFNEAASGSGNKGKQVEDYDGLASGSGNKGKRVDDFDGLASGLQDKGKQVEGFDGLVLGSGSKGLRGEVKMEGLRVEIPGELDVAEKGCDGSGSSKGLSDLMEVENVGDGLGRVRGAGVEVQRDLAVVVKKECDVSRSLKDQGVEVQTESLAVVGEKGSDGAARLKELKVEIPSEGLNTDAEKSNKVEPSNEKEKRKKEIEEELKVLTQRKHKLVQALKQILNVEEEIKRRNAMQGSAAPPPQLKIEVPNDSGSMSHHTATKLGSEANIGGVAGGSEGHDTFNQHVHSRHLLRTSSVSPSSDSLRRPAFSQHNMVPHPSRASMGVSESPSRFAPTPTGQGHSTNLPAVSASGTNYIASSPSPAASGGTSVFRDSRFSSPWN